MINIQKHFKLNNNYSTESIHDESREDISAFEIGSVVVILIIGLVLKISDIRSKNPKKIKELTFKLIKDKNLKELLISFNKDIKELSKICMKDGNIDKTINKKMKDFFNNEIEKYDLKSLQPICWSYLGDFSNNFGTIKKEKQFYEAIKKLLSREDIKIDKNMLKISDNYVNMYYHFETIFDDKGWDYDEEQVKCDKELEKYEKFSKILLSKNIPSIIKIVTENFKILLKDKFGKIEFEKSMETGHTHTGPTLGFTIEYKLSKDYSPLFKYIKENM